MSNSADGSDLILHGADEEQSSDLFADWAQERSLSFNNVRSMDDSILEIGSSKLKISAKEGGKKDNSGRKYSLVAYCLPVSTVIQFYRFPKLHHITLIVFRWTLGVCLSRK